MTSASIIVEPKLMFDALQQLQNQTIHMIVEIFGFGAVLQSLAKRTFAIGFNELIKAAEKDINDIGSAVVAANNAFNNTCKEAINALLAKFAPQGAKSDYSAPPYSNIEIKINQANRAVIYPEKMRKLIVDLFDRQVNFKNTFNAIREIYQNTTKFWVGSAADQTRQNFEKKVVPLFKEVMEVLTRIYVKCDAWLAEALKFEAALDTP